MFSKKLGSLWQPGLFVILFLLALASCQAGDRAEISRPRTFDGAIALDLAVKQTKFGYRPAGSQASRETGDWIIQHLENEGWETEIQEFTYQGTNCRNIIGKMSSQEHQPIILIGAHYDTRLKADRDPVNPDEPVMGANDGASGTAVLLELAHALEREKVQSPVWLVFFDAEDNGRINGWDWIVGSTYLASNLTANLDFVIIVDMVGDMDQQIYYEYNSNPELMEKIWSVAAGLDFGESFQPEYRHSMIDDHTPFLQRGIRAVDIIDFDYAYWHTTEDTSDKLSAESLYRVGRTVEVFLESNQNQP